MTVFAKKNMLGKLLFMTMIVIAVAGVQSGYTATITKSVTNDNLNIGTSWVNGTVPTASDIALWNSTVTGSFPLSLGANLSWLGVQVVNPGGWVTINGNTLTLGASGFDMSAATQNVTVNSNVTLGANQTWNIVTGQSLTINGAISGAQSLTKTGEGRLILADTLNTYSGATIVNAGIFELLKYSPLGASPLTLNGGTLQLPAISFMRPINVTGTTAIHGTNGTIYIAGNFTGNGTLNVTQDSSTFSLESSMTGFSGTINFGKATLRIKSKADTSMYNTSLNLINSGAVNFLKANVGPIRIGSLSGASGTTFYNSHQFACELGALNKNDLFAGVMADSAPGFASTITKIGTGTFTLSGNNTYTGSTTISAGALQIGNGGTSGSIIGNITNNTLLIFNRSDAFVDSGTISGNGAVQNLGAGTVTLTGTNTYNGATTISAGTLQIGSGAAKGSIPSNTISNNGTLIFNRSDAYTFNGIISGTGAVTKAGAGTTTLGGNNTYSGTTTINFGTLKLGVAEAIPKGNLSVTGILDLNSNYDTVSGLSGSGMVTTGSGTPSFTVGYNNATSLFSGIIQNGVMLTKIGTGTLTLSGPNTYPGATTLSAGVLLITNTLASGTITCNGGILGGTGIFAGAVTVSSGASISPGVAAIGTLTVNNNLTFQTGSQYNLEIGDSLCDKIVVSGTVALGNATLLLSLKSAPIAGYSYKVIDNTSSGAINGTFNSIAEGGTITAAFNGSNYTFIISYQGGTGTNDVVLTAATKPLIVAQPSNVTVAKAMPATFTIAATGTAPLSYKWLKNGTDVAGTTASLSIASVAASDNKTWYQCQVKNVADSVVSNPCTLYVVNANFSGSPVTGVDSVIVAFIDSSTGVPLFWKWDFGDGAKDSVQNPSHKYASPGKYTVKLKVGAVAGAYLDSMTQTNFITVAYSKPKPIFSGTPLSARDSATVTFTDLSKGVVTGWVWNFGDSSAVDTSKNPVHKYTKPGSYTVKLKVAGPGGKDSIATSPYIYIYTNKDNFMTMSGRRLSTTSVELTLSNYDSIPSSSSLASHVDSVGLYFKKDSIPLSTSTATLKQTIKLSIVQASAKTFKDTIAVPFSGPADSVSYGFSSTLYWNDTTKSAMLLGNGVLVLMKDTVPPVNPLILSGLYLKPDTASLSLDSVRLLDTTKVDSAALWYGFKNNTNFADTSYTKRFSAISLINGALAGRFTYKVSNQRLATDTVQVYASTVLIGKNHLLSVQNDALFKAGQTRPANPIKLSSKATNESTIVLSWNRTLTAGFDSMRIWKGLKALPQDSIPVSQFTSYTIKLTDSSFTAGGLNSKTRYYFGSQVFKDGFWSIISSFNTATDSTPAPDTSFKATNTIKIDTFSFDALRNVLTVKWKVDAVDTNLQVGMEYSLKDFPMDLTAIPKHPIAMKKAVDSADIVLDSGDVIQFNATYYLSMWVGKGTRWVLPTDSSKATAVTPKLPLWDNVSYFSKVNDTVSAFGGIVQIANATTSIDVTTDTLRIYSPADSTLNGFVRVGAGFKFTDANQRMYVGLKVDTLLIPNHYTLADVRIYRDSAGLFSVEYATTLDAAHDMVWVLVKGGDLDRPFIPMVDTIPPTAKLVNSLTGAVAENSALADTFNIVDNIINASWTFRNTKGANSLAVADSTFGTVNSLKNEVIVNVKTPNVNANSGLRAQFVVSDGVRSEVHDVSRQVLRPSAENTQSSVGLKWVPICLTSHLGDSTVKTALKDLGDKSGWVYNKTKFRLFRWFPNTGNSASVDKYMEYHDTLAPYFDFMPGRLFWIKTKEINKSLYLGDGITSDLTKPFNIILDKQTQTDVSVPFDFPLCIGDIIDATNNDSTKALGRGDSLLYYSFKEDSTHQWRNEPLYFIDDKWVSLKPANPMSKTDPVAGAFWVYNPFKEQVTLRFPGIPVSMSKQKPSLQKKKQATTGWALRINGRTSQGSILSPVYCGHSQGTNPLVKYYPLMPGMEGAAIAVCDQTMRQWGHEMAQGICEKEGGVTFTLAFTGQPGIADQLTCSLEGIDALPQGLRAVIMDPGVDTMKNAAAEFSVTVGGDAGVVYKNLVIGNESYLAKAKARFKFYTLALVGVSPNPFGRMLKIRYSLPFGGVNKVEFSMIDLRGRLVWAAQGTTDAGLREFVWNGASAGKSPVASGMYIFRMKALDEKGKTIGAFEKRLTYLP